eukprot:16449802-Heterocapsa_arctica.AAC.1
MGAVAVGELPTEKSKGRAVSRKMERRANEDKDNERESSTSRRSRRAKQKADRHNRIQQEREGTAQGRGQRVEEPTGKRE